MGSTLVWNLSSISQNRNLFVSVIVLQDVSHRFYGIQIFIALQVLFVMEWWWFFGVPIWTRVIDCNCQTNFTATKDILQECRSTFDLERCELHLVAVKSLLAFISDLILSHVFLELAKGENCLALVCMAARLLRGEEIKAYLAFDILFTS